MKKTLRIPAWLASFILAVLALSAPAQTADENLAAFFRQYLDESFALRPLSATQLGDHRFDQQLDDLSAAGRARWVEQARRALAALPQQVDYARLSRDRQVDFEIIRHELEKSIWLAENTRPFENDPRIYNDYLNDSIYLLLAQSSLPRETNVANAIARMAHLPRVIEAAKQNLRTPPRVVVETAIRQNQGAIAFYETDIFSYAGHSAQRGALKSATVPVIAALKDYQRFLEKELLPRANGEWRLGKEKFTRKLELELDAGLTADQVLADAEAEFERVQREMAVVARQLWSRYFPKLPLPPDDFAGRRETVQRVLSQIAQEHGTSQSLVRDVKDSVKELKRFLRGGTILRLPEPDRCQIIEMPEFQRGNSTAYMNSPPPLDPNATGFYAVSPPPKDWDAARVRSYFEEYNNEMLRILTIHEAYPGHYVQFEYANARGSLPRNVLSSGPYIEGWAVYTEQMMLDQGYGAGDLALRLTQLKFYLRAVVNAILDHKMHCTTMSDAEAMALLTEGAYQSEGEARLKVVRAKQSSAQLSTYFVGRMAHYRTRQQISRELGERFSLPLYHQAVLDLGPVPVKYLPELVKRRLDGSQ